RSAADMVALRPDGYPPVRRLGELGTAAREPDPGPDRGHGDCHLGLGALLDLQAIVALAVPGAWHCRAHPGSTRPGRGHGAVPGLSIRARDLRLARDGHDGPIRALSPLCPPDPLAGPPDPA